jgi:hypothetical protein
VEIPSDHAATIGRAEKQVAGSSNVLDACPAILLCFPTRILKAEDFAGRQPVAGRFGRIVGQDFDVIPIVVFLIINIRTLNL